MCLLHGTGASLCLLRACRPDQIKAELKTCLRMLDEVYTTFGLSYKMALSTRPEKRLGDEALWDSAEGALTEAMNETGLEWEVGALLQSAGDLPGVWREPGRGLEGTSGLEGSWQRPWTRRGRSVRWWSCDCQRGLDRSGGACPKSLARQGWSGESS